MNRFTCTEMAIAMFMRPGAAAPTMASDDARHLLLVQGFGRGNFTQVEIGAFNFLSDGAISTDFNFELAGESLIASAKPATMQIDCRRFPSGKPGGDVADSTPNPAKVVTFDLTEAQRREL